MMASNYANIIHLDTPAGKLIKHWANIWKALFWIVCASVCVCVRKCLFVHVFQTVASFSVAVHVSMRMCVFPRELLDAVFVLLFGQKLMLI